MPEFIANGPTVIALILWSIAVFIFIGNNETASVVKKVLFGAIYLAAAFLAGGIAKELEIPGYFPVFGQCLVAGVLTIAFSLAIAAITEPKRY